MAWLRRFAISLLKQVSDKESIVMRRRMSGTTTTCRKSLAYKVVNLRLPWQFRTSIHAEPSNVVEQRMHRCRLNCNMVV